MQLEIKSNFTNHYCNLISLNINEKIVRKKFSFFQIEPNMEGIVNYSKDLNLKVLKNTDSSISDIIATYSHVVLYTHKNTEWVILILI